MRCTAKKTFQIARQTGNDMIVQVKDNQKALLRQLEGIIATTRPDDTDASRTLARNRQEERRIEVYAPGPALAGDWSLHINAVVRVSRRTWIRSAATGFWKNREETSIYASSVMLDAKTFASAIRDHWAIENCNHWVRDVTLAEDASRIRCNPGIMARLRSLTLSIVRANGVSNVAKALWAAAIDPNIAISYKGL